MGLFKKGLSLSGERPPRQQVKDAVAYFVIAMIYADGDVEDSEVNTAQSSMARCGLFGDNNLEEDFALLVQMEKKYARDSQRFANEYATILKEHEWQYTTAAILIDVMLADNNIDDDEVGLLKELAAMLGLSDDELDAMLNTVMALRRPWTD